MLLLTAGKGEPSYFMSSSGVSSLASSSMSPHRFSLSLLQARVAFLWSLHLLSPFPYLFLSSGLWSFLSSKDG